MQPRRKPRKNRSAMHMVGALVAQFRTQAGMTQQELADRLCISYEKMASIEQGRRPLSPADAAQMDKLLDTKGALAVVVEELPESDKFPMWAFTLVENEVRARSIHCYEQMVVPGLLQTEEYARALFGSDYPSIEEKEIERRVAARMERQQLMSRTPPPALSFVVEQNALELAVGGKACLRRQIAHLRAAAELPFLVFTVMPKGRETHAGLNGPMVLMETPELERLAYSEGQRGAVVIDDPEEVSNLYDKYGMLRSQALTPEATKSLLDKLAGEA